MRWRDPNNGRVHADSPLGAGITLCADALEGECGEVKDEYQESHERITCAMCRAIIKHCKAIDLG